MRKLYNALFSIGFTVCYPYYFLRNLWGGDWQRAFAQRSGHYDIKLKQSITNRHLIWVQAPARHRMKVCLELLRALEERLPNVKFMVSTRTEQNMKVLQEKLPLVVGKMYHPIDRRDCVSRALNTIHPRAIILLEADLRPNFLWRARARGFPLFLVDAHLSNSRYARYKRLGFLFRRLFGYFCAIGARTEEQAVKFRRLGGRPEVIRALGDMAENRAAVAATVEMILSQLNGTDLYIVPPPTPP